MSTTEVNRFIIEKFANGWTVKAKVNFRGNPTEDHEYIALNMDELLNIIECVNDGNYKLEKDSG